MTITEFLKQTIDGKLSLEGQKKYLAEKPFGSPAEIAEAVEYLYGQMEPAPSLPEAVDICGTGGSGLPRVNVSTISAFILAGTGVKVGKHGNNAASGKFGSFDLLSALDVPINLSAQELQLRFAEYNLAFLYAKNFHPAMRFFAPVRSELKQPTFFNTLGPLLSPVKATRQLIGTTKLEYAQLLAEVSKLLGKQRVIVAVGSDGLDEVTLSGPTEIVELKDGQVKQYQISPADFGLEPVDDFSQIASSSPEDNVVIAKAILAGQESSRRTDLVLVNSAMALYLAGKSDDLKQCYQLAKTSLESGRAQKVLEDYCKPSVLLKIAARDKNRDFKIDSQLEPSGKKYSGGLIAEIKKQSPSEGAINQKISVAHQAQIYEQAGTAAISVLSEPDDFGGSFEDLKLVRQVSGLPILCKDFVVRKEHIDKAKSCGADIVLLIAAILDPAKLKQLYQYAYSLDLQVIVEVHTPAELVKALELKPEIIGVNSRNLHDFSINPQLFADLAGQIPDGIIKIAESGISNYSDVPEDYQGLLVGTVLMKHPFPALKLKELTGRPLLKLCGIRTPGDAELCENLGVDMIGINLVPRSKRRVDAGLARQIAAACHRTIPVGIFEDQPASEVNELAEQAGLQAVQLSGHETDLADYKLPIIKTIRLNEDAPSEAFLTIIDNITAGSGQQIDYSKLDNFQPSLIAGGVDVQTAGQLLQTKKPLGIDTASGIETDGTVDPDKIKALHKLVSTTEY